MVTGSLFGLLFTMNCLSYGASSIIKSLRWFTEGDEKSIAVLVYDDKRQDRIVIDFELQAEHPPDLSIVFRFCDRNWNPVNNIFLLNQGQNLAYYQYVTADVINNKLRNENWILLEGNFWETSNVYNIFIFYNDPNYGGYDKIISYQRIRSK